MLSRFGTDSQEVVSLAHKQTKLMILAANLYWGVWALLQSQFSNVDFDYKEYSRQKLHADNYLKNLMFGKDTSS